MRLWHLLSLPFRRGPRRPLAQRRPERPDPVAVPLGLEAVDMSVVDAVNRRNAALERVSTFFGKRSGFGSFSEIADTRVAPFADDETYAARYHRAYNRKRGQ